MNHSDNRKTTQQRQRVSRTRQIIEQNQNAEEIDITRVVESIMLDAIDANSSDIHIEPWDESLVVRFRLHGVLKEFEHLPLELAEKISARLKVMANLVNYETERPQEGHARAAGSEGGVELRLSFFPVVRGGQGHSFTRGEKIVIRIFDPKSRSFDIDQLGFDADTSATLQELLTRPTGMLLLTGPTGSGKTTSIYAVLCHLVRQCGSSISISTVEDPVEFNLPQISQAQINHAREFTYPVALRSLMRQDPQVIMIGEIRDAETAAIAVQAGLTGHLVISTIHAGSTAGVFARMINMDIEPFLLASSIIGILGLRLVCKNCPLCAMPYQPDPILLKRVPEDVRKDASWRRGGGCETCNDTGFTGRTALSEMLTVNEPIRDAVMGKVRIRKLQKMAQEQGMKTLWESGIFRAASGEIPLEEILRSVTEDPLA
ncbi:MAG: putative type II secretion system protein HxcR [Verrucomicrobia subdivision 3 bacterium]|nr:putative type II secretion system protein HxcR [Limisphaerales bacterium]MCS1415453.1 putative type II secretion system protein HxcR [Limisphaerales bacterium]